jgi:tetratricopeptide (TPR) repeat protein
LSLIALAYARVGEYGKASQYAANASGLDPANPRLHGDLGRMLYKAAQYPEALVELRLAIEGGETAEGVRVDGLPLAPGDERVVEFYYTYGLALAKTSQCEDAVQLFQALLLGVPDDETARFNADQGLILCGVLQPTPTPNSGEAALP